MKAITPTTSVYKWLLLDANVELQETAMAIFLLVYKTPFVGGMCGSLTSQDADKAKCVVDSQSIAANVCSLLRCCQVCLGRHVAEPCYSGDFGTT